MNKIEKLSTEVLEIVKADAKARAEEMLLTDPEKTQYIEYQLDLVKVCHMEIIKRQVESV